MGHALLGQVNMQNKDTKINSEDPGYYTKICTIQNFSLYGIHWHAMNKVFKNWDLSITEHNFQLHNCQNSSTTCSCEDWEDSQTGESWNVWHNASYS